LAISASFQRHWSATEAVVQAEAHGRQAGFRTRGGDGSTGRIDAVQRLVAEVDILIFALERPGRRDLKFDAAAGDPADLGAVVSEGHGIDAIADKGMLAHIAIGNTARSVNQDAAEGIADPATRSAKPIDAFTAGEIVAVNSRTGNAIADVPALEISLDAEDKRTALEIVADLAPPKPP